MVCVVETYQHTTMIYYDLSFRTAVSSANELLARHFRLLLEHAEEILNTPEMAECWVPSEICHGPCYGQLDLAALLQHWLAPESPWVIQQDGHTYYLLRVTFGVGGYCYGCHAIESESGRLVNHLRPGSGMIFARLKVPRRAPRRRPQQAPLQGVRKSGSSFAAWERDTQTEGALKSYQVDTSRYVPPTTLSLADVVAHFLPERPLIVNLPHASAEVPTSVRFTLPQEELESALLHASDAPLASLLPLCSNLLPVDAPFSSLVVDTTRAAEAAVPTHTAGGKLLRPTPTAEERAELLRAYYEPHHAMLALHTRICLQHHGAARVLELRGTEDEGADVRLQVAPAHAALAEKLADCCRRRAFTCAVELSAPAVPAAYAGDPRVSAVRLWLRRDLYRDAAGTLLPEGAVHVRSLLSELTALLRQG